MQDEYGRNLFAYLIKPAKDAQENGSLILRELMDKIEETFVNFLYFAKEYDIVTNENLCRIIEMPDDFGRTFFSYVSCLSEKISSWILSNNIDISFVDSQWSTAEFEFIHLVPKMLKKGINPFVVDISGSPKYAQFKFQNIDQNLLTPFLTGSLREEKTAAEYSFEDSECGPECLESCDDKMKRFKLYTRRRKFKNEKSEGQGVVSFGTWHRKPAAFKILFQNELNSVERQTNLEYAMLNIKNITSEYTITSKLAHRNIVKVLHMFRCQRTKKRNGIRSLNNFSVIVMEKHSKNIGELTLNERSFIPYLLSDILGRE